MRDKCGARLALAAGHQRDDLVARQVAVGVLVQERRQPLQVAELAGDIDGAADRTADDDDVAAGPLRRGRDRADARHVGGEGGDGDAVRRLRDEPLQHDRHLALARADAFADGIGGIADERKNALLAECREPVVVGRKPQSGRRVELPIAGMKDRAKRRADGERVRLGNGMGDGDVFDVERADLDAVALLHDRDRDLGGVRLAARLASRRPAAKGVM